MVENYATAIGDYAFDDSNYNVGSTPPSKGITGNITFQNVTSIGEWAFGRCLGLTSMTIGNGVTSIGDDAFFGCSGLTSITIGSNIETIGENAFDTWGNPVTLTIGKPMSWVETRYEGWYLPSGSTIVCTGGTITIA